MSMVLSNPPYVAEGDWEGLQPEVRDHDPREALGAVLATLGRIGRGEDGEAMGAARDQLTAMLSKLIMPMASA